MKFNNLVIDNFVDNPYEMRNFALNTEFDVIHPTNFPGKRTKQYPQEGILMLLRKVLKPFYNEVIFNPITLSGQFQVTTINDVSWIHRDDTYTRNHDWLKNYTSLSIVLYLTPNAPVESGTSFYHNEYENNIKDSLAEPLKEEKEVNKYKYKKVACVANVFNRAVIFDSSIYHTAETYFGTNKYDGRLTVTYFLLAKQ